ncbi:MAG: right-handed parallel beta-helix repeat-containing protein [Bacteroidota bacterium]|nr:right-handed parallel beta-helix repeat-containing protein [Bacteroidota bacterium]
MTTQPRFESHRARHALLACVLAIGLSSAGAFAQLSGTYTIPGSYATIAAAITALNTSGVSGPVVFNVAAGHTETAANLVLTTTTSNATNTITFQRSGTGANPLITAAAGTGSYDGIIEIEGTDYVTFDGIDLQENTVANTTSTTQMEYGYGIFAASATNASQNITIKNCLIRINGTATTTYGIIQYQRNASGTSYTPSAASGVISNCSYYLNTIVDTKYGIYIYGNSTTSWYGTGNTVGVGGGNTITNFGTGGGYGIYTVYQANMTVTQNNLTSVAGASSTLYGIYISTATSANTTVSFNTITVTGNSSTYGIYNTSGSTAAGNTVSINDNMLMNCSSGSTFYGIYNSASPANSNIYNNTVQNLSNTSSSSTYVIYTSGAATNQVIHHNTIQQCTATSTSTFYCIYNTGGAANLSVYDNTITQNTSGGTIAGFYMSGASVTTNSHIYNNTIQGLTSTGTGSVYGIYHAASSSTASAKVYGNTISGLATGGNYAYGILAGSAVTYEVYKNRIYDVSTTSTASSVYMYGIYVSSATNTTVHNNYVSDIRSPGTSTVPTQPMVCGLFNGAASGNVNFYYNTVYLDAVPTGSNVLYSSAAYSDTGSTTTLRNNILVNESQHGGGLATAYWRSSTTLTTYSTSSNNNCFRAGTPGTNNLIYYDGTNSDQTIAAWQTRVNPADGVSFTELPPFVNRATKPYDLHLVTNIATGCESGGGTISGITTDYDGDLRYGATGYSGAGTAPDVGADENDFTPQPCSGTPVGGTAVIATSPLCLGRPAIIVLQGASSQPGITYQWEESDDDGVSDPWAPVTGGSGATTTTYTTPNLSDTIYYRCKVTCTNSSLFSYSTSVGLLVFAMSGVYTINSALPTGGTNFQSFNAAITSLTTYGICGGVTLNVVPGSGPYTEHLSIPPITGASPTDTVLFNGNGEILQWAPTSADYSIIDLNGCDYVTFDSLTVKGLDVTYGAAFLLRNQANYNRIRNCTIDLDTLTSTSSYSAFLAATSSLTSLTSGANNANYCEFRNNTCLGNANGPYYGVTFSGVSGTPLAGNVVAGNTMTMYYYGVRLYYVTGSQVVDNTILDFYYYGVYLGYTTNTTIGRNDITRPTRSTVTSTYAMYLTTGCAAMVIEKNRIHNLFGGALTSTSSQYGIYVSCNPTAGNENLIKNNLFYDLNGEGTIYTIYSSTATYLWIYHNTISLDYTASASTSTTYGLYSSTTSTPGPEFVNNNVTISRGGTGTKYAIYLSSASGSLTSNYNNLRLNAAAGTQNVGYKGAVYATLANWQTLGYDLNSVQVDPLYENPGGGNFKPQNAAMNNIGTNLSTAGCACVTDDILGQPRSTTPDPGAYEFTPIPMSYVSSTCTQGLGPVARGSANQKILGIEIVTTGSASPLSATSFTFNTNGTTSTSDIAAAKVYYTGTSSTFAATNQFGSTVASPSGTFVVTGSQQLLPGTNYFWLAYDVSATATTNNFLDGECTSLNVGGAQTPTVTAPAGARLILGPLAGAYTVGVGGLFPSLSDAFAFIGTVGLSGNTVLSVISDIAEPAPAVLNEWVETPPSSNYTLTIQPAGTWTVSGNFGGAALIKLNGADRVTIDGLNTGGNALTLKNVSNLANSAVIWIASLGTGAGAVNNTIRNCTIVGGSNSTTSTFGIYAAGTTISTSGTGANNNNLTIQGNTVKTVFYGIYVRGGSGSSANSGLVITQNAVGSNTASEYVTYRGIDITGANPPQITQNTVFNQQISYSGNLSAIEIGSDVNGALVSRNTIYGMRNPSTSGYGVYGVNVSGSNATNVEISNNMIYDLSCYGDGASTTYNPFGIRLAGGSNIKVYFNSVHFYGPWLGGTSGTEFSAPLCITTSSVTGTDVRNNIFVNSMTGTSSEKAYCVYAVSGVTFSAIDYNDYYPSGTYAVLGYLGADVTSLGVWRTATGQDAHSVSVNPSFVSNTNLHIGSGSTPNQLESGGTVITGLAYDYDNDVRPGPSGSTNGGAIRPDIGADEFDGAVLDLFPPDIAYTPLLTGLAGSSRTLLNFADITDLSGVNTSLGTRPRIYYKKTTDANTYVGNTSTDNGWKWVEALNTSSPFNFTIDYTIIYGGSVTVGDTIQYFVIAQDNASTPNVGVKTAVLNSAPTSVVLGAGNFPATGTNSYPIGGAFSGTVNVGTGQTYTSLTGNGGLFQAINGSVLSGDVVVNITSDLTEDGTHALNEWSESGAGNWRVQIQPSAAVERVISGWVGASMIRLNGAKRVTIDGSYSGSGRYLRFRNGHTSYPTMELLNGATNDRILNCIIEGGNTNASSGVVVFGASATGNSNNALVGCHLRDRSDSAYVPANLVYSSSSANSADTLKDNALYNFTNYGVAASACGNDWRILSNAFYQTASRSTSQRAVSFLGGGGHAVIANNIGGSASDRSGTPWTTSSSFYGIYMTTGTAQTTVTQNVFGNFNCSGFYGVYLTSGSHNVSNNRFGHTAASTDTVYSSGVIYGIYNSGATALTASSDTMGYMTSTSSVYPIYCSTGDNTITGNSMIHLSGASTMYGIYATGSGTNVINGNTMTDMTSASTFYGIYVPATGTNTITGNTLSQHTGGSTMYNIYLTGSGAYSVVSSNTINQVSTNGTLYGIYTSGTTPTIAVTNNLLQDVVNNTTSTSTIAGIYIATTGTNIVAGNTLRRLVQNSSSTTPTASLYGIYLTPAGLWNSVMGNTLDSLTNVTCQGTIRGILSSSSSGTTIANNTISRLWSQNNEVPPVINKGVVYGIQVSAGVDTLVNNTIYSLHSAYDTLATTFGMLGIALSSATSNHVVEGNTIYGICNHHKGTLPHVIGGLYVASTYSPSVVRKNRIYDIISDGTGTGAAGPWVMGIYAGANCNAVWSNNMVSLGSTLENDCIIYGIGDASGMTNAWYYNSVFVGGTASTGTNPSMAFVRTGQTAVSVVDNLFYNTRRGGTGSHYAIANTAATPATGWNTSDYNLLASDSATTIGLWGTTPCTFPVWRTSSGTDTYSLWELTATLTPSSLFTNAAAGDLSIVATNPNCWYVNGKGAAGSISGNIADDYGATSVRSTTFGFATDIGADEFTTSTTPPAATASGAPQNSGTTTYTFAGQPLAVIAWGSGGTVPTAIDFRYYSGANPPPPLAGNYSNAYAAITATGGSGYTYDITFGYSPAWLGTISAPYNIRLAKRDVGIWSFLSGSTVDTSTKTVTATGLTSFSEFALTDVTNPLPMELVSFAARLEGSRVRLTWKTASELNSLRFEVERRIPGSAWETVGMVEAHGTTDRPHEYEFVDERLPEASEYAYRLKMVDRDGTYEYSAEVRVVRVRVDEFRIVEAYPNPFGERSTVTFTLPAESYVTVRVVDVAGREVGAVYDGVLPSGVHAMMVPGSGLSDGVYTCVVTAGSSVRTVRLVRTR